MPGFLSGSKPVRKQSDVTRTVDGLLDPVLRLGVATDSSPGQDLALRRQQFLEQIDVLVIDVGPFRDQRWSSSFQVQGPSRLSTVNSIGMGLNSFNITARY